MKNGTGLDLIADGASKRNDATFQSLEAERSEEAPSATPTEGGLEVQPRKRRNLSRSEKLRILREYEALGSGQKGLFLRQQGIYSSNINAWRKLRDQKYLESAPKRGRKAKEINPLSKELAETQRQLKKAQNRLELLEKVIEVQKKISEITGIPLKVIDFDEID
jgi:transposase-like protein